MPSRLSFSKIKDATKTTKSNTEVKVVETTSITEDDYELSISDSDDSESQSVFSDTPESPLAATSLSNLPTIPSACSINSEYIHDQNKMKNEQATEVRKRPRPNMPMRSTSEVKRRSAEFPAKTTPMRKSVSLNIRPKTIGSMESIPDAQYNLSARTMFLSNFHTRINRFQF